MLVVTPRPDGDYELAVSFLHGEPEISYQGRKERARVWVGDRSYVVPVTKVKLVTMELTFVEVKDVLGGDDTPEDYQPGMP